MFIYELHPQLTVKDFYCLLSGAPSVTNLTFNDRFLTCTSTGGPATTVTWRRDGVVITLNATYQQTKRVIDNSTSTYQTVLTIDPSVDQSGIVGTYNCTVENARGESSTILVVAGKLSNLLCRSGTSILLFFLCSASVYHCWWKSNTWTSVHTNM